MNFISRTLATMVTLLAATTLAARADTFTYSYYEDATDYFSVTTPNLVATPTTFYANISCSAAGYTPCNAVYIDTRNDAIGWFGYFPSQPFGPGHFESVSIPAADFLAPGTYQVFGHPFSIIDNASALTPEPSSVVLLATGLSGLTATIRRKRRTA